MDGSLVGGCRSGDHALETLRVPDVVEVEDDEGEVLAHPHSINIHLFQPLDAVRGLHLRQRRQLLGRIRQQVVHVACEVSHAVPVLL